MAENREPGKVQEDMTGLGHSKSVMVNKIMAIKDAIFQRKPKYNMDGLVEENRFAWIFKNILHLGGKSLDQPDYTQTPTDTGVYPLHTVSESGEISIALLSDWASDTPESQNIAELAGIQDYSIHMGDTYYVGEESEIAANFNDENGAPWKYGNIGSFAMLGNHEMYTGGDAYFTKLLPAMGLYYDNAHHPVVKQKASFFCLKNEFWKIVCIDTGYDSLRPFLNVLPKKNLELGKKQADWLKNVVFADPNDKQGVIIISHHQVYSAFSEEYSNPLETLIPFFGSNKNVLWFCGHEHRMAVYGANPLKLQSNVFLRCIGHGGMPVEIKTNEPKSKDNVEARENRNLVLYDNRERKKIKRILGLQKITLGHNGFVILRLNKEKLFADYYDDENENKNIQNAEPKARKILTEEWDIDINSGQLTGKSIAALTIDPMEKKERLTLFQQNINIAIGKTP